MFREMRTALQNTADLLSRPQRRARELRLKAVGLNIVEWALVVCGLALAAVVCFVLAAQAARLQKLNELRAKGLISEDEYNKKRKDILDRL